MYSSDSFACQCEGSCLNNRSYGLVAVIEIIEKDPKYLQAFKAKILKVKHFSPVLEFDGIHEDGSLINPAMEYGDLEYITVVEHGVRERRTKSAQLGVFEREEVIVGSCDVGYKLGMKYYFFGVRVQDGIYETTSCSCTIRL